MPVIVAVTSNFLGNWFASYEQWVARHMPGDYREQCLATFPRRALPESEFAERWTMLVNRISEEQVHLGC
jgi:hypothetical protein